MNDPIPDSQGTFSLSHIEVSRPSGKAEGQESAGHPPITQPGQAGRSSRPSRRAVIAALLGLQLLLAAVALAVWVWTPDRPALPPLSSQTAPLAGKGATYESALPLAQAQADAWLPGAQLLNASLQVDWAWEVPPGPTIDLPGTGWLTYSFIAPWDPPGRPPGAASLGIVFERLTGAIVIRDTEGWEQAPEFRPPPPPSTIDSTEATLRAEEEGGRRFRRACPQYRHLSRTFPVADGRTEWPQHWVVIYEDTRVPDKHGLLLRIDAETGKVLARDGDAPQCSATP